MYVFHLCLNGTIQGPDVNFTDYGSIHADQSSFVRFHYSGAAYLNMGGGKHDELTDEDGLSENARNQHRLNISSNGADFRGGPLTFYDDVVNTSTGVTDTVIDPETGALLLASNEKLDLGFLKVWSMPCGWHQFQLSLFLVGCSF
jgi:hypothetical protein